MRATDFLKTANNLSKSQDEWDTRTSISRSYYAVHLEFSEFIRQVTQGRFFRKDRHKSVVQCFERCSDKSWKTIARKLNDLRGWRTKADYEMNRTFKQKNCELVLIIARGLLTDYQANIGNSNLEQDFREAVKKEFQFKLGISI